MVLIVLFRTFNTLLASTGSEYPLPINYLFSLRKIDNCLLGSIPNPLLKSLKKGAHTMANRERNNQLKFYVTNEERFLIQNKMRESNVKNMGAYLRKMAIDGNIFILDNMPLKEMNMNLTRVGSNINQIAKRINSTDRYYKEDVTEIKEMLDEIWQLQKSILLKLP